MFNGSSAVTKIRNSLIENIQHLFDLLTELTSSPSVDVRQLWNTYVSRFSSKMACNINNEETEQDNASPTMLLNSLPMPSKVENISENDISCATCKNSSRKLPTATRLNQYLTKQNATFDSGDIIQFSRKVNSTDREKDLSPKSNLLLTDTQNIRGYSELQPSKARGRSFRSPRVRESKNFVTLFSKPLYQNKPTLETHINFDKEIRKVNSYSSSKWKLPTKKESITVGGRVHKKRKLPKFVDCKTNENHEKANEDMQNTNIHQKPTYSQLWTKSSYDKFLMLARHVATQKKAYIKSNNLSTSNNDFEEHHSKASIQETNFNNRSAPALKSITSNTESNKPTDLENVLLVQKSFDQKSKVVEHKSLKQRLSERVSSDVSTKKHARRTKQEELESEVTEKMFVLRLTLPVLEGVETKTAELKRNQVISATPHQQK